MAKKSEITLNSDLLEMGVDEFGKLALIADLTATDFTGFHTTFIVIEKVSLYGENGLVVVAKVK